MSWFFDQRVRKVHHRCSRWGKWLGRRELSVDTPLNAAASTAGSIFAASEFDVPPYQREYSWQEDEVREFFEDLQRSLDDETYFLGLIILTDEDGKKKIVDGQQRVVTLTLLAGALYHEAKSRERNALADRISSSFLYSIDYETDATRPRVILTDTANNDTLQYIIKNGEVPPSADAASVSEELAKSFKYIRSSLRSDLRPDPFKRLGKWTEFITHKLYFAVFVHPNPAAAYQVFEVINTRGRDLTTADLLKNYTISQSPPAARIAAYERWKAISDNFQNDGANFVQYIRHAVTVDHGHILPKDLFAFLAARTTSGTRSPPTPLELLALLEQQLPLYLQMMDPSLPGPAKDVALGVYAALNKLNVISVRPLMMAIFNAPNGDHGLEKLLKLVIRRIVVGNLGTGNIERRFAEAARRVAQSGEWEGPLGELSDLSPEKDAFVGAVQRRTLNKGVLNYIKNSICARTIIPQSYFPLHFIVPKGTKDPVGLTEGELSYWGSTIGNTFLSVVDKRLGHVEWADFKLVMLPTSAPGEFKERLLEFNEWNVGAIGEMAVDLAEVAAELWYE